ncbi:MAG: DUF4215 domain-containing protein [Deltaproteobacteria bacterium]|nr:DUF4215 domain-containing protein [Deltaproteobacteria bacterium]
MMRASAVIFINVEGGTAVWPRRRPACLSPERLLIFFLSAVVITCACDQSGSERKTKQRADASSETEAQDGGSDEDGENETQAKSESCGNGRVEAMEECDDANQDDEDGCTRLCEYTCTQDKDCDDQNPCNGEESCSDDHACEPGSALEDRVSCGILMWCYNSECVETFCGDGKPQPQEECDDANADDDDGCTSKCLFTCISDDPSRDCSSECNPTARCDESSHACTQGSPLPDYALCNRDGGYCLAGVCIDLDCEKASSDLPPELCGSNNEQKADSGIEEEECGAGGPLAPGTYERTVADDRVFQLYVPKKLNTSRKVPLVFVHHGFTMSGEMMMRLTSWTQIADEEGIVVAFPDGGGAAPWNVGEGTLCGAGAAVNNSRQDDFAFVENMIDNIDRNICIDRTKVFTAGFSMGGYFTHNVACHRPDLVRAVAPHSGGMEIEVRCVEPRPIIILHGDADPLISYECAEQARDQWVAFNGCSNEVDTTEVKRGSCERHRDCPLGAQVEFCSFDEMGHGWAGSDEVYGGGSDYEDAARLAWRFFQEQM